MIKQPAVVSADEAISNVKSGDSIYFSCFGCTPEILIEALCRRGRSGILNNVKLFHTILMTEATYAAPEFDDIFETHTFFVGDTTRKPTREGRVQYIPISLHETQTLFRQRYIPIDVACIAVSPPDKHGYVSLGLSVDMTLAVVQNAKKVIAVVNPNIPRTFGDALIPYSSIDLVVHDDRQIKEVIYPEPSEIDKIIGRHCAELIRNGDCLQLGIGSIPNAILSLLENHKDLGLHTEMFSDGVIPLVEKEIITGKFKRIDQGKLVACFLMGSRKLHSFINDNPLILMKDVRYTNDPFIISQNPNVVAINSAIEVDITGQICADSIGTNIYSGVGGQLDFIYGASRSDGGRAIIAMSSCTNKGVSKIVPTLSQGAGVVTPRSMVHHFITEYGHVDLYGKTLQERAKLLISVAHPSVRESLEKAAYERFKIL